MTKLIINCTTGEVLEKELSKPEKDQQKIDQENFQTIRAEAEAKEANRLAIADRLGLTADELKLLLG